MKHQTFRGLTVSCPYCLASHHYGIGATDGIEREAEFALIGTTLCCSKSVLIRFGPGSAVSVEALEGTWTGKDT